MGYFPSGRHVDPYRYFRSFTTPYFKLLSCVAICDVSIFIHRVFGIQNDDGDGDHNNDDDEAFLANVVPTVNRG